MRPDERRCRPRERDPGELRPTDVVGAFFVCGVAFLLAGVVAAAVDALEPWAHGRWLALHLVFVGGISQLVLGASQFFAGAFLATDPPSRRLVRGQLAAWNVGAIALAVAVPISSDLLAVAATTLLVGALSVYGLALAIMRKRSLGEIPWSTRWYATGAAFFAVGIAAGAGLVLGVRWSAGDLLAAHMALNLVGWFGMAIVGTLHTFLPSLARTTIPFPVLQAPTYAAWSVGVAALAVGYGFASDAVAVCGWIALLGAALLLSVNVAGCLARAGGVLSLPARIVASAQAFLVAALSLALATALDGGSAAVLAGSNRGALALLVVAGWIGLTVLGSLIHLLAVVVRVRDLRRPMQLPDPRWGMPIVLLTAGGVGGLVLAQLTGIDRVQAVGAIALLASYGVLGGWVLALARRVLLDARPRI